MQTLTREQAREIDRRAVEEFGMPSILLMENAGRGVADVLCELGIAGRVAICCGAGNNGGDGFVIARHLDLRGHAVQVLTWNCTSTEPIAGGQRPPGDAAINLSILEAANFAIEHDPPLDSLPKHFAGAAWIIDCLLGTGARGEPRPPLDAVIAAINEANVPVLAVDLPSGLDCDTGVAASKTVRASHTCTFVAPKQGFLNPVAAEFIGRVRVVGIGAPRVLTG